MEKSLDEIVERLVMKEPVQKDGYRAELEKTEQIEEISEEDHRFCKGI